MIPVVVLTIKTLYVNYLLLNHSNEENYAVIVTNEVTFPFPTVRLDLKTFSGFENDLKPPHLYVINTEMINVTQFLNLRSTLGFDNDTNYIFIGEKLPVDFESNHNSTFGISLVLMNPQNYEVWKRSIELEGKLVNSTDTEIIMEASHLRKTFNSCGSNGSIEEINTSVHFLYTPPYTLCDNCENKGIVLDIISMALDLLNVKRKLVGGLFLNPDVRKLADSLFLEDTCAIFIGLPIPIGYDFTQPFLFDRGYWIVRSPHEIPRWSKFSYILSGFNYEKSIESFEDLMENEVEVELPDFVLEFFDGDTRALKYFEKYRTGTEASLRIVVDENKAIGYPDIMYLFESHDYLDSNQRPLLRKLDPPIATIFMYATLRKGNPLTKPLNEKLIHLVEHGFANDILSKYKSQKTVRDKTLDVKNLTLDHIQLSLALWFIGIFLSTVCFLCELKF
ncbi:hypothetical protein HHI36_022069 [Cryptolaemus montrouzieri]|uniref:Uncharacterized protein n=1 Tax=Cryptolaemus montrouzieri TaxID=559131 RepID=A0ABD2N006_9CUCU